MPAVPPAARTWCTSCSRSREYLKVIGLTTTVKARRRMLPGLFVFVLVMRGSMAHSSRSILRQLMPLSVVLFTLLTATAGLGQTYQGGIRGQARDQNGVVPGAEVTLTNDATSASRVVVTNDVGEYVFAGVLPGTYSIRMALPGFKTEERTGIRVGTQQSIVQDFVLEVGAISEQITVTGESPVVERGSATVAASLGRETLQALPIFGRNAFYSSISTPGVVQSGDPQFVRYQDQTNASYLSLGGGPRRGNGYLIEGVPMTDFINRPTIVPSIEAVEEIRVQTKTYEVDMGHAAGGVFNTTARSGSNTWHGSALFVDKPAWATGQLYFAKKAGIENPPQYLLQLGRFHRRPDRSRQDVLLDQHRQLQAEEHSQHRADVADGARARGRLLADAQCPGAAGRDL